MVTEITEGVRVSVETEYQPEYSSPSQYHYVFTYRVTIENNSSRTIQILSREWNIKDAGYMTRHIAGEGVVGQQPIIEPGKSHQYVSGCNLKSGIGSMDGNYTAERLVDGKQINVTIPKFEMVAPFKLN
jgi:ApaG protein